MDKAYCAAFRKCLVQENLTFIGAIGRKNRGQTTFLSKRKREKRGLSPIFRAIHPGEILKGELEELNLSANAFAKALGVPTNRITAILNEQRGITADTALRLAQFFDSTPDFWMSLQSSYDVKVVWAAVGKDIEKNIKSRGK